MERQSALVLTIIFFIIFVIIAYYGAQITFWSSIILAIFLCLILLNIFYPPSNLTTDDADFTLILYAIFEILGLFLLGIYIIFATFSDSRQSFCENLTF